MVIYVSFTAMPKRVEQGTIRKILRLKQVYPAIVTVFSLLLEKTVMLTEYT